MEGECKKRYFEKALVVSNEYAGGGCYCLTLKADHIVSSLTLPQAGQFYMIGLKDSGRILPRPISLYSFNPDKAYVSFVYKVFGEGTKELSLYTTGTVLRIHGPLGQGFKVSCENGLHIIAGGGVGLAPLVQLVKEILEVKPEARILFLAGGKNRETGRLVDFFRLPGCMQTKFCTDDGSLGEKAFVPDLLADCIEKAKFCAEEIAAIYACGPNIMLEKIATLAGLFSIPCQISLERRMACGVRACMGCSVKTVQGIKKVCTDGPVFDSRLFAGMEKIG